MKYLPFLLLIFLLTACGSPDAETETVTTPTSVLYHERYRPQIHFSPPAKWMNDPNGMVYHEGEYHLFYQYYPDSTVWGPMHWGHAVSPDMVTWEHLPIALYPDSLGYIFSGSAVIDHDNTSGLGKDGIAPMVAIYSYHDMDMEIAAKEAGLYDVGSKHQTQGIAYSLDNGRTFTKYAGNPVMPNTKNIFDWRDPKVSWHEPSQQWVMVLAARDIIKFYASPNLIDWTHLSDFGKGLGAHRGVWECPDLFELPLQDSDESRWVLLVSNNPGGVNGGSATQYFVGDFDGTTFAVDPEFRQEVDKGKGIWLDYGRDNYAGVTWANVPEKDGRRLFLGWMGNWLYAQVVPTAPWRSAMTLPRELSLRNTPAGVRVFSTVVPEVEKLRGKSFNQLTIPPAKGATEAFLRFKLAPDSQARFGVEMANEAGETYRIGYDAGTKNYFSDRTNGVYPFSEDFGKAFGVAPRFLEKEVVTMHFFFDAASVELFADGGATVLTECLFPAEDYTTIATFIEGDGVTLTGVTGYELEGIWE
jgi:fructan beta-fructosidase